MGWRLTETAQSGMRLLLLLTCSGLVGVDAMRVQGNMLSSDSWLYVARFCFLPSVQGDTRDLAGGYQFESYLEFDMTFRANDSLTLLVYAYDDDWNKVYERPMTCKQKYKVAKDRYSNAFPFSSSSSWEGTNFTMIPAATLSRAGQRAICAQKDPKTRECNYLPDLMKDRLEDIENDLESGDPGSTSSSSGLRPSPRSTAARVHDALYGNDLIHTKGRMNFISPRTRWYYFVLANCDESCEDAQCQGPSVYSYSFHMVNGDQDMWRREFSADQIGVLETDVVFFTMYFVLIGVALCQWNVLRERGFSHHTVKLSIASIIALWWALMFSVIHLCEAGRTGYTSYPGFFKIMSKVLNQLADGLLILLAILFGKGWTVVRRKISATGRTKISVSMTVYACMSLITVIWGEAGFPPGLVVYFYQSPPGVVFVCVRASVWLWFTYACYTTVRNYPQKRRFYCKFYMLFSLWIAMLPLQVLVATSALDKWDRAKFVNAIERVAMLFAHLGFIFLFMPGRFNLAFPFHAKTSEMIADGAHQRRQRQQQQQQQARRAVQSGQRGGAGGVRANRRQLSGGVVFGDGIERVKDIAGKLRYKLMALQDHADDLQSAVQDCEGGDDAHDVDFDDNSGRVNDGTSSGGGGAVVIPRSASGGGPSSAMLESRASSRRSVVQRGSGFAAPPLSPRIEEKQANSYHET